MTSNRAERLQGVTERRAVGLTDFEMRAEGNTLQFSGYPSLFDLGYDMYGGPDKGGWTEYVDSKAFDRTLGSKPDVVLNLNHGNGGTGLPLARTTSGTLELSTDKKGLVSTASLDLRDPDVQALQVKTERGDVNQMSFAFRTIRQEWNDEETTRTLQEVSLDRGDVSIVTNGAQPKTSMQLREMIERLAGMDPAEVQEELRSLEDDVLAQLEAARALLAAVPTVSQQVEEETESPTRRLSIAHARRIAEMDRFAA
jgi:HK97 family phage prohead protease